MPHYTTFPTTHTFDQDFRETKTLYSLHRSDDRGAFTVGEDAHDGYPGGLPTASDYHGSAAADYIDMSKIAFDQTIHGFAGDDEIIGGFGENLIVGGLGNDTLTGNDGFDTLVGGDGDDFLGGGADDDELHAGDGADQVNAGTGDDFIFLTDDGQTDLIIFVAGDGHDVIDGFEVGVDKLLLSQFDLEDFNEVNNLISYNATGQALLDLGGGDQIILTGLDGPLGWDDFLL
ncbi:MAG: hypothetical protein AAFW87_03405 [Pseudomonadota bacterium]